MNRLGGYRERSRYKFRKSPRDRGKLKASAFMQSFDVGQKVHLTYEPAYQKGLYHARFKGKTGVVKASRGACYEIAFADQGKEKMVIVHPVHLKVAKE